MQISANESTVIGLRAKDKTIYGISHATDGNSIPSMRIRCANTRPRKVHSVDDLTVVRNRISLIDLTSLFRNSCSKNVR